MEEATLIADLIKVGPVVTVLLFVIRFLWVDRKELKLENKLLNEEIRECGKENIIVTKDLNTTLGKLVEKMDK